MIASKYIDRVYFVLQDLTPVMVYKSPNSQDTQGQLQLLVSLVWM